MSKDRTVETVGATFGPAADEIGVSQERSRWCWAASTQMLRRHVGLENRTQCQIAALRFSRPCCETPEVCNVGLPLDQITALLSENALSCRQLSSQLDDSSIWEDLYARRPILIVDVFENGKDGHARVIFGWQTTSKRGNLVRVLDPAHAKRSAVTIAELRRSRWAHTWHRIEAT